ncbi:nucleoside-diphosphate sugar epimerase/dehydratase [Pseudomonas sp. 5Ae-yellow]|uniref:polysaccharide biosynthesis protein n=1 Tax=Pseudomonas sp. 5Ae-yellow TaxID=2759848 RepID=UPI0015F5D670|nr:nucleoside-diphosphate sugar epimerase/dehydratase [Pseudomonas sp. 5Ae-yellow]MBA6420235.1 polysaccharide biosynthesis protein [Pseudomonas sp. 5Ae-yellow]
MFKERLIGLSYAQKRILQITVDIILIWSALWLSLFLRLGGEEDWLFPSTEQLWLFVLAPLLALPIYIKTGMYRAVMRHFGNQALIDIFKAVTLAFAALAVAVLIGRDNGWQVLFPRAAMFSYWSLSLLFIGGLRLAAREYFMGDWLIGGGVGAKAANREDDSGMPVAIFGAGEAGNQLLASLRVGRTLKPRAFVDDDPSLEGRMIAGLTVYSSNQVGRMMAETGVQQILLAVPSASRSTRQKILNRLAPFPLHVRSIPGIMDIASGKVKVDDLQEIDVADLLGRDPVAPADELLEFCIRDQVVMVTGAGGSIGSELCRQIINASPRKLILFEHNEYGLYAIHSELQGWIRANELDVLLVPILGSVRNGVRLEDTMSAWGVNTVYHAAAYKHVPMVEHNVAEGIMNNVFGTLKVAQAAIRCQVQNCVLISTDKAVRPTNVMGATKRLAEMVLQALSAEQAPNLWGDESRIRSVNRTRFTMVRFGNVLGSSGSVIPLFRSQIARGGPITITHPDITRYFMTIPEAAQLVVQAGSMGQGGDVFVLDMGEPVAIVELARKMVMLSGMSIRDEINPNGDIAMTYTGLRPGEKLYEELLLGDNPSPTAHPKIHRANEDFVAWSELRAVLDAMHKAVNTDAYDDVRALLLSTVQGYQPGHGIVDLIYEQRQG